MSKEKEREIIEIECPKCGCKQSYKNISKYSEGGECISCGELTYFKRLREYDLPSPKQTIKIECPYCHSTNTKKISTSSKVSKVALFGIFSIGKVTKQWHCNNCKSDF